MENYQPGQNKQAKEPLSSLLLKIGVVAIIFIIGAIILLGIVLKDSFDPITFIINIAGVILLILLLGLAVKGILSFIKPKPFSPTESFRDNALKMWRKVKPFTVRDLYLRGEDMMSYAKIGKIIGIGYLPYLSSKAIRDEDGKIIYEKDENGNTVMLKQWSNLEKEYIEIPKPKEEIITDKDGDIVLACEKNAFPLNILDRSINLIRANRKYVSDLIGDVFIKSPNLVPYGEWYYPVQQWQEDIKHIAVENQSQALITTHRDNLDLASTTTQASLGADPTFQKIMMAQSERLTSGFNSQS